MWDIWRAARVDVELFRTGYYDPFPQLFWLCIYYALTTAGFLPFKG